MAETVLAVSGLSCIGSSIVLAGGIMALGISGRFKNPPQAMKSAMIFFTGLAVASFLGVVISIEFI